MLNLVYKLRKITGLSIFICNTVLKNNNWNLARSVLLLENRNSFSTTHFNLSCLKEGAITFKIQKRYFVILVLLSQTDFVIKGALFLNLIQNLLLNIYLYCGNNILKIFKSNFCKSRFISRLNKKSIDILKECIYLKKVYRFCFTENIFFYYTHSKIINNISSVIVITGLTSRIKNSVRQELSKRFAMHITARNPVSLDINGICNFIIQKQEKSLRFSYDITCIKFDIERLFRIKTKALFLFYTCLEQYFIWDTKISSGIIIKILRLRIKSKFSFLCYIKHSAT